MSQLSKQERRRHCIDQSSWQSPEAMAAKVEALSQQLGEICIVGAGMGFWRDAYGASKFAKLRSADEVRLVWPDERPDFEMKISLRTEVFEFTEADFPDRRRGDEYRQFGSAPIC